MGFLLKCPACGERDVYEFRFGGEMVIRPIPEAPSNEWAAYCYERQNIAGNQHEWWYHTMGCRKWFQAVRSTVTNHVSETAWPEESLG